VDPKEPRIILIISGPFLLFGAICIAASYILALKGESPYGAGRVMSMPALFTAAVGIWGIFHYGHDPRNTGPISPVERPWAFLLVYSILYCSACFAGTAASRTAIDIWAPDVKFKRLNEERVWREITQRDR
jgi:hypothetical protein